jgi:ABC-2 type transport system ATP-binding protein
MSAPVIVCERLTKRFGDLEAVSEMSLEVRPGEVFGLLGPNGAGKSTAMRCLLGMLRPSSGSSSLFGLDSWRDRVAAHRRIGVLPSDFDYEDGVTGREFLRLLELLRGTDMKRRATELSERLHANLDKPLNELSRGNRQKIGLLAALAHDPELVIMDEPTAGLDPLMQEEFLSIVGELKEAGRTVLLSSHNMAEVERACDRAAMIREGKLLETADISSLLERAPRHVRAVFTAPVDASEFSSLDGVSDVNVQGNAIDLNVRGGVEAVVSAAAGHELVDFICERPSLETTFVELYQEPVA